MLKLTNSFYRYFTITCERLDYYNVHVRKIARLSCRQERCSLDCVDLTKRHSTLSLRKNSKKARPHIKIQPINCPEFHQTEQMNKSEKPTVNHVSYGGNFNVSSDDKSGGNWQKDTASCQLDGGQPSASLADFRVWEPIGKERRESNYRNDGTFRFKVVSYNVLAQYLLECHPYLYTNCNPSNLKWKIRAERLYYEIISLEPDILCLQEVQVSHLKNFYSRFEEAGYSVIFKQKTGSRQDGCAIYFKSALFELLDHVSVEFYQPDLPILNRDNIGVMVKLAPRGNETGSVREREERAIVVATTHLLYNPKRTDVRLAQMQVLLAEIDRFAFCSNDNGNGHLPIILTGDFNSVPDSAVIRLLDKGHVSASNYRDDSDWERIGVTDNCQHLAVYLNRKNGMETDFRNVKIFNSEYSAGAGSDSARPARREFGCYSAHFNSDRVAHSLPLTSAYDKYKRDGCHEASTFQDYWLTVDYIYFSRRSNLRMTSRLRLPTAFECNKLGYLPNEVYASDHLALAAVFELIDPSKDAL